MQPMRPRIRAINVIITSMKLYARNFKYFILFPLIFGSFASLGSTLALNSAIPKIADYQTALSGLLETADSNGGAINGVDIDALVALTQDFIRGVAPALLLVFVYMMTAGLLLNAFVFGGMARAAMNVIRNAPLPSPTQSIYSELKHIPKWFAAALLRLIFVLLAIAVPFGAVIALSLVSGSLAVYALFALMIAVPILALTVNTAASMFFPVIIAEDKGFRRMLPRTWALFKKRPGLVMSTAIWLVAVQMISLLLNRGSDPVSIALALIGSALVAPVSAVAACLLYGELREKEAANESPPDTVQ